MDRGPRPRDQKGFLHLLGAGAGVRAEQPTCNTSNIKQLQGQHLTCNTSMNTSLTFELKDKVDEQGALVGGRRRVVRTCHEVPEEGKSKRDIENLNRVTGRRTTDPRPTQSGKPSISDAISRHARTPLFLPVLNSSIHPCLLRGPNPNTCPHALPTRNRMQEHSRQRRQGGHCPAEDRGHDRW